MLTPSTKSISAKSRLITRFAPSPTGLLHLGHAYSAILNYEAAVKARGRFLLRIEDIDVTRCKPEFESAIYEDLEWLGLHWDADVWRQSERFEIYAEHLENLASRGLVYRCFKTRKDIQEAMGAPHQRPEVDAPVFRSGPLTPSKERDNLAAGKPFAWRLSLDAVERELGATLDTLAYQDLMDGDVQQRPAHPAHFGDVVLGRKDIGTSYHLSSVLDDAAQGVTHVIRGEDLREAAGLHVLLHRLLGLEPPLYQHHKLILNNQGERLSKRDGAESMRAMRACGVSSSEIKEIVLTRIKD
ncbi:MAG: tRNA glutamyl-Q(34) synthetase GluQRS [Rhodospirillaceae bacterium]